MPEETAGATVRARAAQAIAAVRAGRSLDAALADAQSDIIDAADRSLVAALAFGVLRDWRLLTNLADALLRKRPEPAVYALILAGLHQLRAMRVPPHAAVHASVAAAALLGRARARGLVNAVLRRYQREQTAREAALPEDTAVRTSHPDWLVARLRADWPDDWRAILEADNRPAPMTLRVNRRRAGRGDYLRQLEAAGQSARAPRDMPDALILSEPVAVESLPGFTAGAVSVQDAAAQFAAPLLDIRAGMRVLDACAAPGGKAAHCLELADCELLALDVDERRLAAVDATFARLGLSGRTRCADASEPGQWWDGRAFDRILIDAPCTGTGVIRRHPDIKWLRRASDVATLARRQRALLDALWPLLAPGGILVYATCSTLRAEGAGLVGEFLSATPGAGEMPIIAGWGEPETVGRRIAPGAGDMDGFYYARLSR